MLDEFVEHTSVITSNKVSSLQYEGFEPDQNDADFGGSAGLEAAVQTPVTASAPIFELGRVQCAINAPLVSLVVCSDVLLMGLSSNVLILIELSHATQVDRIPVGGGKPFTLYRLFMDPSGRHVIITSTQGDNWYMYRPWRKAKPLSRLKGVIESVAWNKAALLSPSHPTSSREILLGTRNGVILEALLDAQEDLFKPNHDRYVTEVMSLPDKNPITGINLDFFPPTDPRRTLVVVTTPSRIYQFVGTPKRGEERIFASYFAAYRDVAPRILELPGDTNHSELHYYTANPDQASSLPRSLAWMTAHGIYHGSLNFESTSDDFIDGADVIPYPSPNVDPAPVSIALTEFHLVMLYPDRIAAVCILDGKLAFEESLPLKAQEQVRGLTADPVRKTFWVYTDQSLFELLVGNEDRDVWKIYLHQQKFDVALQHAKTAGQRNHILSAQANAFFKNEDYFKAAQCYSQCSVNFEDVALKFLDAGERDALRSYLTSRLERTRKTDRTQRMMLATWLVEFYLTKCNELDDAIASESLLHDVNNFQEERNILQADLRQFFETYKSDLNRQSIYELIQGHGRTDVYLHYANVVGDYDRVVEHWILEEEWTNAIGVINRQSDLELYYRFSTVLMRHSPQDTVDSWLKQPALDPHRLIPALLQQQHVARDPLSPNQAVRYLHHLVFEQQNSSSTLHNLLVTFYASRSSHEDETPLLRFLSTAPSDPLSGRPYYDLDYALRICKQTGRTQSCVHIYSKMGLWENSVDLSLEKGDLELAKINADMPQDDEPLRKKLWLKIARYVVQDKNDIKTAMQFLESTDLLKIEDILPFFPDFVVIDDFKEDIAQALEGYSAHIDSLKNEMNEATRTAESIKQDMAALKNRFVTIDAGEQCSCCSHLLFTRQFYVFPCRHTFHADCLIGLAKEYLSAPLLRRMVALQDELTKGSGLGLAGRQPQTQRTLLSANFIPLQNGTRMLGRNLLSAGDKLRDLIVPDALAAVVSAPAWIPGIGGRKSGIEVDGGKKAEKLRAELEELLASSCPLCESVVVGLDKAFVKEGEADQSWTL